MEVSFSKRPKGNLCVEDGPVETCCRAVFEMQSLDPLGWLKDQRQTVHLRNWLFARHTKIYEVNCIPSRKNNTVGHVYWQWQNLSFQEKIRVLETLRLPHEHYENLSENFGEILMVIGECNFMLQHNKIHQHLGTVPSMNLCSEWVTKTRHGQVICSEM